MTLTREQRIQHRRNVIVNGGVFTRDDLDIVKAFDDDTLIRLSAAADERTELTANAGRCTCNGCGGGDQTAPAKKKKTKKPFMKSDEDGDEMTANSGGMTMEQWLAQAPVEAQEVWNRATKVAEQEKAAVVAKLVGNSKHVDDAARKKAAEEYAKLPIETLHLLASVQAPPTGNGLRKPNYAGAAGGAVVANRLSLDVDQDDLDPMPTFNSVVAAEKNGKAK